MKSYKFELGDVMSWKATFLHSVVSGSIVFISLLLTQELSAGIVIAVMSFFILNLRIVETKTPKKYSQ